MQISIYFLLISNISLSNSLDLKNLQLLLFLLSSPGGKILFQNYIIPLNIIFKWTFVPPTARIDPYTSKQASLWCHMFKITPGPHSAAEDIKAFFYSHARRASGALRSTNPYNWCSHWENAQCLTITQEGSLHPSKPTLCPAAGALKLSECSTKIFVKAVRIFLTGSISSHTLNIHMEIHNSLRLTRPHTATTNAEVHY